VDVDGAMLSVGLNEGDALVVGLEEMLGPEDLLGAVLMLGLAEGDALVLGLEEMLGSFVSAAETCFDSMQKTEDSEFQQQMFNNAINVGCM
jgi:hypothetical protein